MRTIVRQDLSSFSAQRPLFPGLLAVFLIIANQNLMASLEIFYLLLFLYLNELIWFGSANRAWLVRLAKFDVATDRAKIEFDLG